MDVVPEPVMPKVNPMPVVPRPETSPAHISGLSNKRNGAKADDIWGGFRQGPDGNCVTVSAIKAAMHKFGQSPTDIYKRVNETARGYEVTMRDGFNLTLSKPELAQASEAANFLDEIEACSRMLNSCLPSVASVHRSRITMAGRQEVSPQPYRRSITVKMSGALERGFSVWG